MGSKDYGVYRRRHDYLRRVNRIMPVISTAPRTIGITTQLSPMGIPGRRYGSFAGKAESAGTTLQDIIQVGLIAFPR